jgi:ribose 5-phosphate isomerase B
MEKRKIYIGADSAGYELKSEVIPYLLERGYEVVDCGTDSTASCHYPDFAGAVCENVKKELDTSFGILICGTGIGMSMCANKYKGIRAAVCSDTYSAKMTRQHNDANVLCIGARVIGSCLALDIVDAFLSNGFEGGRHAVRVEMMMEIENK